MICSCVLYHLLYYAVYVDNSHLMSITSRTMDVLSLLRLSEIRKVKHISKRAIPLLEAGHVTVRAGHVCLTLA